MRAEDPVEQLLLTLKIGMPVMPHWYSARCPQVESPGENICNFEFPIRKCNIFFKKNTVDVSHGCLLHALVVNSVRNNWEVKNKNKIVLLLDMFFYLASLSAFPTASKAICG